MKILEKLRIKFRLMLSLDRSPRDLARATFLGVLIGLSPYIGFHTYIALFCSTFFNLPVYPLILGAYITNPITIPFIYGATTKFGAFILGRKIIIPDDWSSINLSNVKDFFESILLPFIVGTHVIGLIAAILSYLIVYFIATRYQAK